MRLNAASRNTTVVLLSVLLVSCGAMRPAVPNGAEESTRLLLVMRDLPDGEVSYAWQQAEDFELPRYRYQSAAGVEARHIVLAGGRQRS
jgi:hypothetical protein